MGIVTPEPIRDARFDTRIIAELRALLAETLPRNAYPLTRDELDALLAAADERDALKREATDDVRRTAPMTLTARAGDTLRVSATHPRDPEPGRPPEPIGVVLSSDTTITVERARLVGTEGAEAVCVCGGPLVSKYGGGKVWMHTRADAPRDCIAMPADHPSRAVRADDRFYCVDCGAKVEREKASPTGWKHAPREVSFSTPGPVGFDHYARVV